MPLTQRFVWCCILPLNNLNKRNLKPLPQSPFTDSCLMHHSADSSSPPGSDLINLIASWLSFIFVILKGSSTHPCLWI